MLKHQAARRVEAEAGAHPRRFRREERIEDPLLHLRRNPMPSSITLTTLIGP